MTAALIVKEGPAKGSRIEVSVRELIIGRESPAVEGRLGGDGALSRQHASLLALDDGRLVVEDLGSRNGTYVNDRMIEGRHVVGPGDVLQLGTTVLTVVGMSGDTVAARGPRPVDVAYAGGVGVGGDVRADHGGVAAARDIYGGVQTVSAETGGSAAGRDIVHQERYNYDASGWGLITETRGTARALIVLGVSISLVGFVSFAYPIVRALTEGFNAPPSSSGPTFHVTPWLPLGFALIFVGGVVSTIGMFSIRKRRD